MVDVLVFEDRPDFHLKLLVGIDVVVFVAQVCAVVAIDSVLSFLRTLMLSVLVLVLCRWRRQLFLREWSRISEKSGTEVTLDFLFRRENVAQRRDLVAPG